MRKEFLDYKSRNLIESDPVGYATDFYGNFISCVVIVAVFLEGTKKKNFLINEKNSNLMDLVKIC